MDEAFELFEGIACRQMGISALVPTICDSTLKAFFLSVCVVHVMLYLKHSLVFVHGKRTCQQRPDISQHSKTSLRLPHHSLLP